MNQDSKFNSENFKIQKIILIVGLSAVFIGLLLLVLLPIGFSSVKHYAVRPIAVMLLSFLSLYRGFTNNKKTIFLFLGFSCFFCSVVILLSDSDIIPYSIYQLWPFTAVASGLSLFISSFIKKPKIRASSLVPSVALVSLGALFLLFSLDIIKISFRAFAARWWPVLIIFTGIILVVIFFHSQYTAAAGKKSILSDDDDIDEALL